MTLGVLAPYRGLGIAKHTGNLLTCSDKQRSCHQLL
ncbi:hypothetical protein F383_32897 [Gossypium arboreum]|uniref:Uncharacterized protein n=1 Tax=Gossypium arboreum TaxID=29729 RepID=A0A0B0PPB8_GOSAR|nr:hypothetical protein F383_32897 [Gossypium arboreum]